LLESNPEDLPNIEDILLEEQREKELSDKELKLDLSRELVVVLGMEVFREQKEQIILALKMIRGVVSVKPVKKEMNGEHYQPVNKPIRIEI
jgi:hypothetical protein